MALRGTLRVTTDPGGDEGALVDGNAGEDGGVGADGSAALHHGDEGVFRGLLIFKEAVAGEGGVGADVDVVFDARSIPKLNAALQGDAVADDDIVFDEGVIADIAIAADFGAGKHMGKRPDTRAIAHADALDESGIMLEKTQTIPRNGEKCITETAVLERAIVPLTKAGRAVGTVRDSGILRG